MKQLLPLLFPLFLVANQLTAQSYWQQEVNYDIEAQLFPNEKLVRGSVSIEYINNSPRNLDSLVFHIWPNAYSHPETPLGKQVVQQKGKSWYFADDEERGYIDSLSFIHKNRELSYSSVDPWGEIVSVKLNAPLKSGDAINLDIPFRLKVPKFISRMGTEDNEFHFCHWFPKPAVFDKNGWNYFPYLDQGEFYQEFGSMKVELKVPKNYTVAASGNLLSGDERDYLRELESSCKPSTSEEVKTLRYELSPAFDFAWFTSPEYCLKSDKIKLADNDFETEVELYYGENMAAESRAALKNTLRALEYLSDEIGAYPYESFKVVLSQISTGGGMEYPGIVLIDEFKDPKTLDIVIAHEAGHQWFMGMLGSNERKHAWMDEGINSFYEQKYTEKFYGDKKPGPLEQIFGIEKSDEAYWQYAFLAHQGNDQPIGLPADSMSYINYGIGVYQKGALNFHYLEEYLGADKLNASMKKYFNQFKFKHPNPDDLLNLLEKDCNCDLAWLEDGLINSNGYVDYKIKKVKEDDHSTTITLKNNGDISSPVFLAYYDKSGKEIGNKKVKGFEGIKNIVISDKNISIVRIDPNKKSLDYNRSNNRYKTNSLFKKIEKPSVKLLASFDKEDESEVYLMPIIGSNQYDGFMLGLGLYNSGVIPKNFEWGVFPLFGLRSDDFVGQGFIRQHFNIRSGWLQKASIGLTGRSYNYATSPDEVFLDYELRTKGEIMRSYLRINPEIRFQIRPKSYVSGNRHVIEISSPIIRNESSFFDLNPEGESYYVGKERFWYSFQRVNWTFIKNKKINSWQAKAGIEYASKNDNLNASIPGNYLKAQGEITFNIDLPSEKDRLQIRLFAGSFIFRGHESFRSNLADFRMLSFHGEDDYTFSNLYPGRTARDDFWSKQIYVQDGGMKINIPEMGSSAPGRTNQWLTALNASLDIPGKIPFRLFADLAYYPERSLQLSQSATTFAYSGGVSLPLFNDFAEVYFPFFFSEDLELQLTGNKWFDNIRFRINFDRMNPFELVRNISL